MCFPKFFIQTEEKKPKCETPDIVGTTDSKKTYSKGDTLIWSYKLSEFREIFNDTIPSFRIDNLPERYNEGLLKKNRVNIDRKKRSNESFKQNLDQNVCVPQYSQTTI